MAKMNLTGGPELQAALRELGGAVASRLGDNAVRAGARVLANEVKVRAPVQTGGRVQGGRLKKSIKVSTQRQKRSGEAIAAVVSDVFYAKFVEFGTAHASANPFMRPAMDTAGQAVLERINTNLWNGIQREAAKLRKK